MVSKADNSSPKQKKYMVYLDEGIDSVFQKYLHDNYGQSLRVISATFTKALIMLLRKEGYLDSDSKTQQG